MCLPNNFFNTLFPCGMISPLFHRGNGYDTRVVEEAYKSRLNSKTQRQKRGSLVGIFGHYLSANFAIGYVPIEKRWVR